MEEQIQPVYRRTFLRQKMLPYSVTAMVFGIVSIGVFIYFGWVAGIVALVLRAKAMKIYNQNPANYKPSSLSMLKAARICGIIGLITSIVFSVLYIFYLRFLILHPNFD